MNQDQSISTQDKNFIIDTKDLYKILIDTRSFEITMFWTRSNYFLILNSAIAVGFFNTSSNSKKFALIFTVAGLLASMLWFWVCLGGKYWQARWEQRLLRFEQEHLPEFKAFSATPEEIRADVEGGLGFHKISGFQKCIYRLALNKPSVSYSMILLSMIFFLGWFIFFAFLLTTTGQPPLLGN